MTSTDHVRVPKAAELVAGDLRRRIVRGELAEGAMLPPEAQLMEQFGISRPTLREAFRVLESESLIVIRRGARGGARVNAPELATAARFAGLLLQQRQTTLRDVYHARLAIEPAAAGMLARTATKATVATLHALLADEASTLADPLAFARSSTTFHLEMVRLAGNRTLAALIGMLHDIIEDHTAALSTPGPRPFDLKVTQLGHRAHAKLVRLVEAGDGDGAERFWAAHMEAAGALLLRDLGARTVVDLVGW